MYLAGFDFSSWLSSRSSLVVPSRLLASVASVQLERHQLQDGLSSWERPGIFAIDEWLTHCWREARYRHPAIPTLLSPAQELLVWSSFIERDYDGLFDLQATARLCLQAAAQIAQWDLPLDDDRWADHPDARQFLRWYQLFEQRCRDNHWIARWHLWNLVPAWVQSGILPKEPTVFCGFESTPKALSKFTWLPKFPGLDRLEPGLQRPRGSQPSIAQELDFPSEIVAAARWIRLHFEQHPTRSFAVFVPALPEHHSLLSRQFEQVFYPEGAPAGSSVFHVNHAEPLARHPLLSAALLILGLAEPRLPHADAEALLRSPYLAGAVPERHLRARADIRLRSTRELDVSLHEIEWATRECPLLTPIWSQVRDIVSAKPEVAELAAWTKFTASLLAACGWPGDAALTTGEQDILDAWQRALTSLCSLALVAGPVTFHQALRHLKSLLSAPGIPIGDWSSPVQILDSSAPHFLSFDFAFSCGLSEETWPPRILLSPFIPLPLQRVSGIPGSDRPSIRATAQRRTQTLFSCAPVSAATFSGRLSPLVRNLVALTGAPLPLWPGKTPLQSYAPAELHLLDDTYAPPYDIATQSRGGSGLLKAQSACPFKAFAEIRLNAQDPNQACFGFDALDRGNFVHKALEEVWKQLGSQVSLRQTSDRDLQTLVAGILEQVVSSDERDSELNRQISLAERARLEQLLCRWLNLERHRLEPFTVQTVEQERTLNFEGLALKLRIDRVDRLPNGKLLLIDYKSGKPNLRKWESKRPEEPQLLVYASAFGEPVDGIFFGKVNPSEVDLMGISRNPQISSKQASALGPSWDAQVAQWDETVRELAREFVHGYAAVDPLKNACTFCGLDPLCRVGEKAGLEDSE